MQQYYVYILASQKNGTLYTGVTNNLTKRIFQHKNSNVSSFTEKYSVKFLVYFEIHKNIVTAIQREKRIKKWNRQWKIELIQKNNPNWQDLYPNLLK